MEELSKMEIFTRNVWYIDAFPEEEITYDMCLYAAKSAKVDIYDNRSILHFIPEKFRTYEVCEYAIKHNGIALMQTPTEMIDYNLCTLAMRSPTDSLLLSYVPKELLDRKLCKLALMRNPREIINVPDNIMDKALCKLVRGKLPQYMEGYIVSSKYSI